MYYVYVLATRERERNIYVGYASDLERRIREHESGQSSYTRGSEWELVYYEAYGNEEDARERERKLKQDGRSKHWLKQRIKSSLDDATK